MTHGGPLAATAADAALSYLLMASPLPPTATSSHTTSHAYGPDGPPAAHISSWETGSEDLHDVRLGIFRDHFSDATPEVVAAADATVSRLVARGATLVPIFIPNMISQLLTTD